MWKAVYHHYPFDVITFWLLMWTGILFNSYVAWQVVHPLSNNDKISTPFLSISLSSCPHLVVTAFQGSLNRIDYTRSRCFQLKALNEDTSVSSSMSSIKRITPSFAAHAQENHRLLSSSSSSSAFHEAFSATSRSLDDAHTKDGSTQVHPFLTSLRKLCILSWHP